MINFKRSYKSFRWPFAILFSIVIMIVEIYGIYHLALGNISVFVALLAHALLLSITAGWVYLDHKIAKDIRLSLLLLILTAFTGPFGAFMTFSVAVLYPIFSLGSHSFKQWLANLFPREHKNYGEFIYERVAYGLDDFSQKHSLAPFKDIILLGTENQKRHIIGEISRFFKPEFVPALQAALHDPSNGVRVQAANVLAQRDQEYAKNIMRFDKQAKAHPDEPKRLLKLAHYYRDYADSGLLDEERMEDICKKALDTYLAYQEKVPEDTDDLHPIFADLYMKIEDYDRAESAFLLALSHESEPSDELLLDYMEVLFLQKKFDRLHEFSKSKQHESHLQDRITSPLAASILLWSEYENKTA